MFHLYVVRIKSARVLKAGISEDVKRRRGEIGRRYGLGAHDAEVLWTRPLCKSRSDAERIESEFMGKMSLHYSRLPSKAAILASSFLTAITTLALIVAAAPALNPFSFRQPAEMAAINMMYGSKSRAEIRIGIIVRKI